MDPPSETASPLPESVLRLGCDYDVLLRSIDELCQPRRKPIHQLSPCVPGMCNNFGLALLFSFLQWQLGFDEFLLYFCLLRFASLQLRWRYRVTAYRMSACSEWAADPSWRPPSSWEAPPSSSALRLSPARGSTSAHSSSVRWEPRAPSASSTSTHRNCTRRRSALSASDSGKRPVCTFYLLHVVMSLSVQNQIYFHSIICQLENQKK